MNPLAPATPRTAAAASPAPIGLPRDSLEAILELFPDAALAVDEAGRIVHLNQRATDLFGYGPGELLGKPVESLVPARLRATHRGHRREFAAAPRTRPMGQGMELSALRKDGTEVPVEISLHPVQDRAGTLVLASVRDVSERRSAAQALRESEARWRTLVESAPNVILRTDLEGRIQFASGGTRSLNPEVVVGTHVHDFVPPEHRAPISALLRRIAATGEPGAYECPVRGVRGEWRVCKAYAGPIPGDGGVQGLLVTLADVTRIRRGEAALRESESRYRLLAENASDVIVRLSPEGRVLYVSPAVRTVLGFDPSSFMGVSVFEFLDAAQSGVVGRWLSDFRDSDEAAPLETTARRADGGEVWLETRSRAVRHPVSGEILEIVAVARDVTPRHRAEEELRRRSAQLAEAQRIARLGSWEWEVDSDTVEWSDEMWRLFGREPGARRLAFADVLAWTHPEDREHFRATVVHALETGEPYAIEHRAVQSNGLVLWLAGHGSAQRDASGRVVRMRGTAQDVTERKAAEAELRFLASLVDSSHDAIWSRNLDGIVTSWNPAAERMMGYAAGEMIGRHIGAIIPPDRGDEIEGLLAQLTQRGAVTHFETVRIRKDGTPLEMDLSLSPIFGPGNAMVGAAVIARDITDRKRAEEELLRRQEQLAEAQRVARMGSWAYDLRTGMVERSEEALRILGVPDRGGPVSFEEAMTAVHPEDAGVVQRSVQATIEDGRPLDYEVRVVRPDGGIVWVLTRGRLQRGPDGRPVRLSGTALDITERKRAEESRRLAQERLLEIERLERHARQVEVEALKEQDAFRSRLIDTASHELKTPLTAIRLWVDILRRSPEERLDATQRRALEGLDLSVSGLALLVDDMLDVGRLQSGRLTLLHDPLALEAVVAAAAAPLRHAAANAGLTLEVAPAPASVEVVADAWRVQQVVHNLLSNAIKFTPPGGKVTVEVARDGGGGRVRVRDTGVGFTRQQRAKLFQPFSQVHAEPRPGRRGSGLGLFICKGIVEQHGGRIWAESAGPGKGSTFAFWLPSQPRAAGEGT